LKLAVDLKQADEEANKEQGNAAAGTRGGLDPNQSKGYERVGARNMFELMDAYSQSAVIKVIGVGGGGGNAVAHMVTSGIDGVEFMCINTDSQALKHAKVKTALQIGCNITKGLGAGADPEVGRQAAMEDRDRIVELVEGCDMLFITAGMGGGTGTGAAPVVAQVAKELGILTVAVVTKPFEMEGNKRGFVADHGIAELGKYCDSLITIPNQKLLTVLGPQTTLLDAFKSANQVLQGAVQGIAELITRPGLINVDFADVRTVMAETGMAMMGSGAASGEGRAREAAEAAVSSPLLEDINLAGAHGILVNVTAGMDLSIGEFQEVGQIVKQFASEDATVVVGTVIDPELSNMVRVTVVATGLGRPAAAARAPSAQHRETSSARDPHSHRDPLTSRAEPAMRVVRRGPLSNSDYAALDKPTVQRQRAVGDGLRPEAEAEDLLDIPAFLRRQAD
jgi:cell division protein FtsZ